MTLLTNPTLLEPLATLVPTSVKTANYTAAPGDLVVCATAAGTITVTLPTAPPDRSRVAIVKVDSGFGVSVACGGSDVLNAAGTTGRTISDRNAMLAYQYSAAAATWYVLTDGTPTNTLDFRYASYNNQIIAGTAMTGGGQISGNVTLNVALGTTATTAAAGNDSRITGAAPAASPALTGTPTAPTAAAGTNTTQIATTAFVQTASLQTGGTVTMQAVQTSNYSALAGDFVPVNAAGGAVTVTLPSAPANGTRVAVAKMDATLTAVTVTAGGSDAINRAALTAPTLNTPSTATTGGTLAAGTYFYKLTAVTPYGETTASAEVSKTTTGSTSTITNTWSAVSGASGYRLYRSTATGAEVFLVALGTVTTYTDTGAVTAGTASPPGSNTSGATSLSLAVPMAVASLEYSTATATWYNQEASSPCDFSWCVQSGTRATGYGDTPEGPYFNRAACVWVRWRTGTQDASGTNTLALYSNTSNAATGSAVTGGTTTLTATSAGAIGSWIGPLTIPAGTFLQTNVLSVGTTPGSRLYMDVTGVYL